MNVYECVYKALRVLSSYKVLPYLQSLGKHLLKIPHIVLWTFSDSNIK